MYLVDLIAVYTDGSTVYRLLVAPKIGDVGALLEQFEVNCQKSSPEEFHIHVTVTLLDVMGGTGHGATKEG